MRVLLLSSHPVCPHLFADYAFLTSSYSDGYLHLQLPTALCAASVIS